MICSGTVTTAVEDCFRQAVFTLQTALLYYTLALMCRVILFEPLKNILGDQIIAARWDSLDHHRLPNEPPNFQFQASWQIFFHNLPADSSVLEASPAYAGGLLLIWCWEVMDWLEGEVFNQNKSTLWAGVSVLNGFYWAFIHSFLVRKNLHRYILWSFSVKKRVWSCFFFFFSFHFNEDFYAVCRVFQIMS